MVVKELTGVDLFELICTLDVTPCVQASVCMAAISLPHPLMAAYPVLQLHETLQLFRCRHNPNTIMLKASIKDSSMHDLCACGVWR